MNHNNNNSPFINRGNFTLSTNHPLIENSQEYLNYSKYVAINSNDRDVTKYPNASDFEIELPEDINNVIALRLYTWNIPPILKFTKLQNNVSMIFKFNQIYNPGEHGLADPLQDAIFEALYNTKDEIYIIDIENGNYNGNEMSNELTNKFNEAVTNRIVAYFNAHGYSSLIDSFILNGGYEEFIMAFNAVTQKLWFGNRSSTFILENETVSKKFRSDLNLCPNTGMNPSFLHWGLPGFLGLDRCNTYSSTDGKIPRFYYKTGSTLEEKGYWLLPNTLLPGSRVSYIEATFLIELEQERFIYMELDGYNCVDKTMPFNLNNFTFRTNQTNGVVNSFFALIPYNTYDTEISSYKFFYPPADRIRKLKIKMKMMDGTIAQFGDKDYTLLMEFCTLIPQTLRNYKAQNLGFSRVVG